MLAITCARKQSIIGHMHSSLKFPNIGTRVFDKEKVLLCMFLFKHYLESYFGEEVKHGSHKICRVDLDSPCQELFVRGLGFVITLSVFPGIVFLVRLLRVQSSCKT